MIFVPLVLIGLPVIVFWRSPPVWSCRSLLRIALGVFAGWAVMALGMWVIWLTDRNSGDNFFIAQGMTMMGWLPILCYSIFLAVVRVIVDLRKWLVARKPRRNPGKGTIGPDSGKSEDGPAGNGEGLC